MTLQLHSGSLAMASPGSRQLVQPATENGPQPISATTPRAQFPSVGVKAERGVLEMSRGNFNEVSAIDAIGMRKEATIAMPATLRILWPLRGGRRRNATKR
ncbi:hypothetical protein [Falsigemmobacter faecalis]|uniref:Uncharacterized protein n=1 Tax=Falsigemmobacter faecalis TaxID=2488730 RepID=A0A3P3DH66_9RHOB|nr:hypothetical protein [Falsigemmobacter faecalis]RRH73026.1 hypothetical protein EG244_13810 [Falsigemmobacter faecalis]